MINRLHIYSRGRLPSLKPSASAGNLNLFSEDSVVTRLDHKLKEMETKRGNLLGPLEEKTARKPGAGEATAAVGVHCWQPLYI